jgi:hypothetical protein
VHPHEHVVAKERPRLKAVRLDPADRGRQMNHQSRTHFGKIAPHLIHSCEIDRGATRHEDLLGPERPQALDYEATEESRSARDNDPRRIESHRGQPVTGTAPFQAYLPGEGEPLMLVTVVRRRGRKRLDATLLSTPFA